MFEIKGAEPMWAPLYAALKGAQVGQLFTYDELAEIAGYDVRENRQPLYQAIKRLEMNDSRTAANVPNEGYQIAEAAEHIGLSLKHQLKAKRQMGKAKRKVNAADRTQLSQDQREKVDGLVVQFAKHESMLVNHERRLSAVERSQKVSTAVQRQQANELERMKAMLTQLGINVPE